MSKGQLHIAQQTADVMERWAGRVAVVTGASVGIGAAVAQKLVHNGLKVVGLARRANNIQALAERLKDAPGQLFAVMADLSKEEDILAAFQWVTDNLGGVDVLVNNAGVLINTALSEGKTADWKTMYDVNVLGLSICTREALRSMEERGVNDGHIVHINSITGHSVLDMQGSFVYTSTKHAVTALTEGLRRELCQLKSHIRVTSISPGAVKTDMIGHLGVPADEFKVMPMLLGEDIADAVVYALSTPPRVQVHEITIRPTGEKI